MLTKLRDLEGVGEYSCDDCEKPIGFVPTWSDETDSRDFIWVDGWALTCKTPLDPHYPKWCDDCVVTSPIPFHKES